MLHVYLISVRPVNAPVKYTLGRQHISDENQVKVYKLDLIHYECRCCKALHFMHVGKAKFGEATFSQRCKRGKEMLAIY